MVWLYYRFNLGRHLVTAVRYPGLCQSAFGSLDRAVAVRRQLGRAKLRPLGIHLAVLLEILFTLGAGRPRFTWF